MYEVCSMLTKKQKNLLIFINKKIRSSGISPSYEEMKNSLNLKSKSGIHRLISALEEKGAGHGSTEYRLKDWLLSRQRFWGTPIPMLHCDTCGVVPVPYEQLPVELPLDVTFSWEESGNPLARSESFLTTTCPQCNGPARRETDTMDTFYDSSWYFMRFVDSSNDSAPFDREAVDYWMNGGVDLYIGGIEHAVMHLLYARFFTKATRDLGMNEVSEPFGRLVCQGTVSYTHLTLPTSDLV